MTELPMSSAARTQGDAYKEWRDRHSGCRCGLKVNISAYHGIRSSEPDPYELPAGVGGEKVPISGRDTRDRGRC